VGDVATLVPALGAVLMLGLSLASWLAKRTSAEGRAVREMRALNVAALRYIYHVDLWAARNGHELPDKPKELTMDHQAEVAEAAEKENSAPLAEVAQLLERYLPGGKT
jgi:hypothetical protein